MTRRASRSYEPAYPYTLLFEALDAWRAEVIRDVDARNRFLEHIQPTVEHCVGRMASLYGVLQHVEDMVGFTNLSLLESWLPRYLSSKRKVERSTELVAYFTRTVRGYALDFIKHNYDPLVVQVDDRHDVRSHTDRVADRLDRAMIHEVIDRRWREHLATRRRSAEVDDVAYRVVEYLVWQGYEGDGIPA